MNESANTSLNLLLDGNARYRAGTNVADMPSVDGQAPVAAILACADSRLSLATVFDCEPGHLFSVRVAGQVLDSSVIGSLEYAVDQLAVPVLMVLGHTHCGAVAAALSGANDRVPDHLATSVERIRDLLDQARVAEGPNQARLAEVANVRGVLAELVVQSAVIRQRQADGALALVGAIYDLETGAVRLLD